MADDKVGTALDSQTLHQRQQHIVKPSAPTIIAFDLQTPANVGSIYRLADASAAAKIIFVQKERCHFKDNKTVKRTSRNTSSHVATEYWSYEQFESDYKTLPTLVALELTSKAQNVFSADLPKPCSFIIGSERYGISDPILKKCDCAVKIPMLGNNGSMNVSHALAICLYEWHRQHTDTN